MKNTARRMMRSASRRYRSLLFKALITAALLAWVFYQVDLYRTMVQWQEAEWLYVALLAPPVCLACLFINALRWRLILGHQGLRPPLVSVAVIYLKAAFFGAFLPGGMTTGDIFRIRLLTTKTQNLESSIKSVLLDRASGFFGLLIIVLAAVLYSFFQADKVSLRPYLNPVIVLILLSLATIAGLYVLQIFFHRLKSQHPLFMKLRSFLDMIPQYFANKHLILKEVSLSLALQFVIVGWVYIVAKALRLSVTFAALSIATPLVTLVSLLPISLGGVGVREAGYVFFLAPFGLTAGEATSLSLVSGLVQMGLRLICGFLFFWDPSKNSWTRVPDCQPTGTNGAERL
jgi:glycosyltransferase 2 family protein